MMMVGVRSELIERPNQLDVTVRDQIRQRSSASTHFPVQTCCGTTTDYRFLRPPDDSWNKPSCFVFELFCQPPCNFRDGLAVPRQKYIIGWVVLDVARKIDSDISPTHL